MSDVGGFSENVPNDDDDVKTSKEEKIKFLKNTLKYYQSRSLSLDTILVSKQQDIPPLEKPISYKVLQENVKRLHDDIMFMVSLKDCAKFIKNNIACSTFLESNDLTSKRELLNKCEGIIYLSKSIMKLYNEKLNEMDVTKTKMNYLSALSKYEYNLKSVKNNDDNYNEDDKKALEKAELHVYKINLIRALKAVLIGFTSVHYPAVYSQFEKFRSPIRRNFTLEDFSECWDIDLPSSDDQNTI